MDYNIIFLIVTPVIAVVSIIITNIWNNKQRKERLDSKREIQQAEVERTAREKTREEQALARDLLRENERMIMSIKDDMKEYIDKGDLDVKRELAYAIKLIEKDIHFIQQFIFGKESKSTPAYLRGETETLAHDAAEGEGLFRDTAEEADDRKEKDE